MGEVQLLYITSTIGSLIVMSISLFLEKQFKIENGELKEKNKLEIIKENISYIFLSFLICINSLVFIFGLIYSIYLIIVNLKDKEKFKKEKEDEAIKNFFNEFSPNSNKEIKKYIKKEFDIFYEESYRLINYCEDISGKREYSFTFMPKEKRDFYFVRLLSDIDQINNLIEVKDSDLDPIKNAIIKANKELIYINNNINSVIENELKNKDEYTLNQEDIKEFEKINYEFSKYELLNCEDQKLNLNFEVIKKDLDKMKIKIKKKKIKKEQFIVYLENTKKIIEQYKIMNKEIENIKIIEINHKYK